MSWSRCHQRFLLETRGPQPSLPPWPSITSIADRLMACDGFKKQGKYHPSDAEGGYKLLRFWIRWRTYPNREILDSAYHTGNRRFLQPLIKLMSENKLLRQSNSKSSAIGYNRLLMRKAVNRCNDTTVPALQNAITTAGELDTWWRRESHYSYGRNNTLMDIPPSALDDFIKQSDAKGSPHH